MALLHRADLTPTKLELLASWLPSRPWYRRPVAAPLSRVAACRFDDPAGEVGIETILVRAGDGPVLHTPLTYRDAPLAGGGAWLLGTSEHSVLGTRWVYDACGDPVYAAVLAAAIVAGTGQAEEFLQTGDAVERRAPAMTVTGSGLDGVSPGGDTTVREVGDADPTEILTVSLLLAVRRVIEGEPRPSAATLTGTWAGSTGPVVLAHAEPT